MHSLALLVVFILSVGVAMAEGEAPTEPKPGKLRSIYDWIAYYEPFMDGKLRLSDTYTVTSEESGHSFDAYFETRFGKYKHEVKRETLDVWFLPIEAHVRVPYDEASKIDFRLLRAGLLRSISKRGVSIQLVSFLMRKAIAPGVGTETQFELGHVDFKKERSYRDGKWLKFVFKGEASYGWGGMHDNAARIEAQAAQKAETGDNKLGASVAKDSTTVRFGGSAGILFRDVVYLDLNSDAAYVYNVTKGVSSDGKNYNGNSDMLEVLELRAGSVLSYSPNKHVNFALRGDLFHYRSNDFIVVSGERFKGKDVQTAKQTMLTFELRY